VSKPQTRADAWRRAHVGDQLDVEPPRDAAQQVHIAVRVPLLSVRLPVTAAARRLYSPLKTSFQVASSPALALSAYRGVEDGHLKLRRLQAGELWDK
jgi:hypothetical protein